MSRKFVSGCCLKSVLSLFIIGALLMSSPAAAGQKVPEKLVYSLSWTGIPVGIASQEIVDMADSRRIVSTARSNAWLSAFFPVDDRTESTLAKTGTFPGEPRNFRMLFKEGARVRDREISFDVAARTAKFHDRSSGEQLAVRIAPDTYDIYSSFYYIRQQPFETGKSLQVNILDGKKLQRIEVRVLKRERIRVPAGEFDTIKIEPLVKPEGVFEGKRGVYIWLTDDDRRIPVKAQTKVPVGSVTAVLTGGSY